MHLETMNPEKTGIFVARAGYGSLLAEELKGRYGVDCHSISDDAVATNSGGKLPVYNKTVFARQFLPLASSITLLDFDNAIQQILRRLSITAQRANRQSGHWTLHSFALEDNKANQMAIKLEKAVLAQLKLKIPKLWKRYLDPHTMLLKELDAADFVVQLHLATDAVAWFSVGTFSGGISPYIGGNLRMRARADAPSRSARKIEEALRFLGRRPALGETAVDLGAAPGGWTYALARYGASVTAVDAADLALPDTKTFRDRVHHVRDNGLHYQPPSPVDWLCCDMIVASHETLRVLNYWLEKGLMRHFIINLKLPKNDPWAAIEDALALLARHPWPQMMARHLFHDRWEITLIGSKESRAVATSNQGDS